MDQMINQSPQSQFNYSNQQFNHHGSTKNQSPPWRRLQLKLGSNSVPKHRLTQLEEVLQVGWDEDYHLGGVAQVVNDGGYMVNICWYMVNVS